MFEQVEDQMNPSHFSNDMLWHTAGNSELMHCGPQPVQRLVQPEAACYNEELGTSEEE